MQRGTATVALIFGGVVLLFAFWLGTSNIRKGEWDCGSAASPATDFAAYGVLDNLQAKTACDGAVTTRRWFAVVTAIGGGIVLVFAGQALNATPASEPQATSP